MTPWRPKKGGLLWSRSATSASTNSRSNRTHWQKQHHTPNHALAKIAQHLIYSSRIKWDNYIRVKINLEVLLQFMGENLPWLHANQVNTVHSERVFQFSSYPHLTVYSFAKIVLRRMRDPGWCFLTTNCHESFQNGKGPKHVQQCKSQNEGT